LNTALVAMMAPVVVDWCRRRGVSPSRLLIPVSYLAILGGVCTLIGTSTTLVVNAKLSDEFATRSLELDQFAKEHPEDKAGIEERRAIAHSVRPMGLFEIGRVGLPCAIAGGLFMVLIGPRLLPNHTELIEKLDDARREYLVEMLVQAECPLIGKTIEDAGLRSLPGLFLIEIDREGDIITPVTPRDRVQSGDRLIFTGIVTTIVDLEKIPGLTPAVDMTYEFHPKQRQRRRLTEVVLSRSSPIIGLTVREAGFRQRYNAAVVAVHRNGLRVTNKVGNIRLEAGDTLLLQTQTDFVASYKHSREFYLVSSVEGAEPRRHDRAWIAGLLAAGLIVWLVVMSLMQLDPIWTGLPAVAALTVAVMMIVSGCLRVSEARQSIDVQTIVTVAAALGLGLALTESGAAGFLAGGLINGVDLVSSDAWRPYALLVAVYIITMVFTEMLTNNAVAAMLFPLAVETAYRSGYDPRPFIMAISLAASLSFVTPVGYQTNLMVMGPGGYRSSDYWKCGGPLAVVVATTALFLIPWVWPF
ncbi:MAG: SLC13 family permease, partial [bacterium]|nr:SLC13 family permease [bacterium]